MGTESIKAKEKWALLRLTRFGNTLAFSDVSAPSYCKKVQVEIGEGWLRDCSFNRV